MRELSLFTGIGGGIYGSLILGWETVAYVEKNEHCQAVIKQRQADGWFDKGEVYGDIAEFNKHSAHKYTGRIDVLTGGFPCQPFSVAGKRQGTSDERYLFDEIIETIKIVQPSRLFFENVAGLLSNTAIIEIYSSIEKLGYRCSAPLVLGSSDCGNIHKRERVWIYATHATQQPGNDSEFESPIDSQQQKPEFRNVFKSEVNPHAGGQRVQRGWSGSLSGKRELSRRESIRSIQSIIDRPDIPEPLFCGMDDELPAWREQLRATGNGQDPIVMATAYALLSGQCNQYRY